MPWAHGRVSWLQTQPGHLDSLPPREDAGKKLSRIPFELAGSKILTGFPLDPPQDVLGRNQEVNEAAEPLHHMM